MASFSGTPISDTLTGSTRDDRFLGSGGNDTIIGNGGFDVLDYSGLGASISIVLATSSGGHTGNSVTKGHGLGTDTFRDIDLIVGSQLNDRMQVVTTSNPGNANLYLFGAGGNDTLIGSGDFHIYADYLSSGNAPVVADLAAGTAMTQFGNDTLINMQSLRGSSQGDMLLGNDFDNRFVPMAGSDVVDGRGGFDSLFVTSIAGVTVSASSGTSGTTSTSFASGASVTTYSNIELVLTGDGIDTFNGSAGNDRFAPAGGNDTVNGGDGLDTVDYGFFTNTDTVIRGILANLGTQSVVDYTGATDTLTSVEAVRGSRLNDTIIGSDGANLLVGNEGNDSLVGAGGNDSIEGGNGNDFHDGGAGYDQINFQGTARRAGSFALEPDNDVTFTRGSQVDTYRGVELTLFVDGRMVFDANDVVAQVNRLYGAAFLRGADQGGLNGWSSVIGTGVPIATVAQRFLESAEFAARYGTNLSTADFVERLYDNALGRASDPGGKAGWVNGIDSGQITRADALVGFSESGENRARTQGAVNAGLWDLSENAAFAARLYDTTLGRLPDFAGLRGWKEGLDAGSLGRGDMVNAFVGSAEFAARYGANPSTSDFVELLYVNALRRASDAPGKAGWVNGIDSGQITRADAVLGFSESGEHIAFTNPNIMNENPDQFGILFAG